MAAHTVKRKYRVIADHADLGEGVYHEWVEVGQCVYADAIGRKNNNGWTRWLKVICNNTSCNGEVLVNTNAVCNEVAKWIEKERG